MHFLYEENELLKLKKKDKKLAELIDDLGIIERKIETNLFLAIIRNIIAQQISNKALVTILNKFMSRYPNPTAETLSKVSDEEFALVSISPKKALYIREFSQKVHDGSFNLDLLPSLSDEEAINYLTTLKGIGVWTAQMLLIFTLNRKNILSFDDLGIKKGLCALYHHKKLTKELFMRYQKRFSPFGSIASFYLWDISKSSLPHIKDFIQKKQNQNKNIK
ncbi:MAG: hypothetical protein SPK04_06680 [Succinivibrionaceae bacterium]|nr:hypothetical protein [Succinivibrionaceae bacterium]